MLLCPGALTLFLRVPANFRHIFVNQFPAPTFLLRKARGSLAIGTYAAFWWLSPPIGKLHADRKEGAADLFVGNACDGKVGVVGPDGTTVAAGDFKELSVKRRQNDQKLVKSSGSSCRKMGHRFESSANDCSVENVRKRMYPPEERVSFDG